MLRSGDSWKSDLCIYETAGTSICCVDCGIYCGDVIDTDHWWIYWMLGWSVIDLDGRLETGNHIYYHVCRCTTV